ncbi:MAG: hypothetical protein R2778_12535 [Saprospiraceae bacterium]
MCKTIGFLSETGAWNGVKASNFESVMPDNTAIVLWAGFDNQNKFYEHLSDKTKGDFERFMLPWAGNEAFMAVTEPLSSGLREDLFYSCLSLILKVLFVLWIPMAKREDLSKN